MPLEYAELMRQGIEDLVLPAFFCEVQFVPADFLFCTFMYSRPCGLCNQLTTETDAEERHVIPDSLFYKDVFIFQIWVLVFLIDIHGRSEEHTSELQSRLHLVCRLLLEK